MNAIGCLSFALGLVTFVWLIDAIDDRDYQNDRQLYDLLPIGDSTRMKRPFCNAFTGCGKKRSIAHLGDPVENDQRSADKTAIPLPIYRALLRAANREINRGLGRRSKIGGSRLLDEYSYPDLSDPETPSLQRYQS